MKPAPGVWVLDPNRTYLHFSVYKPHLYPKKLNSIYPPTCPSFTGLQYHYKFKLFFVVILIVAECKNKHNQLLVSYFPMMVSLTQRMVVPGITPDPHILIRAWYNCHIKLINIIGGESMMISFWICTCSQSCLPMEGWTGNVYGTLKY